MRLGLTVLLILVAATPALADSRADLYRALDLERAEGDYAGALELYRRAAQSKDAQIRAEARLGSARCLRRLGKTEEARKVLTDVIESEAPARYKDAARKALEKLPSTAVEPPVVPEPPPDPEDKARRERELEEIARRELAGWFVSQARAFYREARFDDARDRIARALALDPTHEGARDLLAHLGDTPGGRERLIREILGLLDYERELRVAELQAEADARIAAGEEALRAGDLDLAAARFAGCVRLVDANPDFAAELAIRHRKASELFRRAITRGAKPPDDEALPPAAGESAWRSALKQLLIEMAADHPGTNRLRILDVDLPPGPPTVADADPNAFRQTGPAPDAVDRLVDLLPAPGGATNGAFVRRLGRTVVVAGPPEYQGRVVDVIGRIRARQDRPIRMRVMAIALSPEDLSLVHGTVDFGDGHPPAGTIGNPEQADRVIARFLSPKVGDVVAQREITLLPGASVVLSKRRFLNLPEPAVTAAGERSRVEYGLSFSLLAIRDAEGQIRLSAAGTLMGVGNLLSLPVRGGTKRVAETGDTGFALVHTIPEGGAGFSAGLQSPFRRDSDASRSTLLLVFKDLGTGETPPDATEPPAAEGQVPVDLKGLDARPADDPSPAFRGEGPRAAESREGFLLRHLWEALGDGRPAAGISLSHGAVWVESGTGMVDRVRGAIDELIATQKRLYRIRLRAAVVSVADEERLAGGREPVGKVMTGEGVRIARLAGDDLRRMGYTVTGAEGRYPLLREVLIARPTQLVHTQRSTRYSYLSGFFVGPTGTKETAFPVYDAVEEGLAVEVRPTPGPEGSVRIALCVRVARILDSEEDRARPERPVLAVSEVRLTAVVTKANALLVSGLPAPTPVGDRRERLVLLVEAAETTMPE